MCGGEIPRYKKEINKMRIAKNVPDVVIETLDIQNAYGWLSTNSCTYYVNGDNPNVETNKAVVYHQLQSGSYVIKESYTF